MTEAERAELRARIDREQRARLAIPVCPGGWASQYGYRKQGCRCQACLAVTRAAWRRHRARHATTSTGAFG